MKKNKLQVLQDFIDVLAPVDSSLRNLIKETANPSEFGFWSMVHESIVKVANQKIVHAQYRVDRPTHFNPVQYKDRTHPEITSTQTEIKYHPPYS